MAGLADLKRLKKEIDAAAALAQAKLEAERAAAALAAKRKAAAQNLFKAAVGKVQPMAPLDLADLKPTPPPPTPLQRERDAAAALQESLSDEVDVTTLLDTDEHLSFRRPGVGMDVVHKLRKGKWSIQRQIDLHGLRSDEARDALGSFIRESHKHGIRCVRVVHGKGLGSPGKAPVLKEKVHRWLVQKAEVVAFVQAPPMQGGAGALVVLLQPFRTASARP
jgi:DNA-nicking Smr family endonuclease